MIRIKRGVILAALGPEEASEILSYAQVADEIWKENGWGDVVITAGIEGNHLAVDFHYRGHALDLRYPGWPDHDQAKIDRAVIRLRELLPDCDILAKEGAVETHIHIEPKGPVR